MLEGIGCISAAFLGSLRRGLFDHSVLHQMHFLLSPVKSVRGTGLLLPPLSSCVGPNAECRPSTTHSLLFLHPLLRCIMAGCIKSDRFGSGGEYFANQPPTTAPTWQWESRRSRVIFDPLEAPFDVSHQAFATPR